MTHLGQRLSALIDGELDGSERERVLIHMARCGSCRDEVSALRTLKRRMNALGEAAAGAGLTGRLMGLSNLMELEGPRLAGGMSPAETIWPPPAPAGGWPVHGQPGQHGHPGQNGHPGQRGDTGRDGHPGQHGDAGQDGHPGQGAATTDHGSRPDQRAGRYFLAGSVAVFLAGLGTAAFIAGGEPQAQAPSPPVIPSVDVLVVPHSPLNQAPGAGFSAGLGSLPELDRSRPAGDTKHLPRWP